MRDLARELAGRVDNDAVGAGASCVFHVLLELFLTVWEVGEDISK